MCFEADSLIHVIEEPESTSRIRRRLAEISKLGSDEVSTISVSRTLFMHVQCEVWECLAMTDVAEIGGARAKR